MILNTTLLSSMLKKKHIAIAYHRVREAITAKIINVGHIDSKSNCADILTKPLTSDLFHGLLKNYLFRMAETGINEQRCAKAGLLKKCKD